MIQRSAADRLAVSTKVHAQHRIGMSPQRAVFVDGKIPNLNRLILAAAHELFAVGTEDQTENDFGVAFQRANQIAGRTVKDFDEMISARAGELCAIRAEDGRRYAIFISFQRANRLP